MDGTFLGTVENESTIVLRFRKWQLKVLGDIMKKVRRENLTQKLLMVRWTEGDRE